MRKKVQACMCRVVTNSVCMRTVMRMRIQDSLRARVLESVCLHVQESVCAPMSRRINVCAGECV